MDAPEDRVAYLESVLIGGREAVDITIVDYDERWPGRFAALLGRIRTALSAIALDVQHIGSTAVPGLAAKPIIDILLTVQDVTNEAAYVSPLVADGFEPRVREADHRMLRTPGRDVHVHVYEPHRPAVRDHLDLRDWLRRSPEDRRLYAATKRDLATRRWTDMNDYADAKGEVILAMLARARGTGEHRD